MKTDRYKGVHEALVSEQELPRQLERYYDAILSFYGHLCRAVINIAEYLGDLEKHLILFCVNRFSL